MSPNLIAVRISRQSTHYGFDPRIVDDSVSQENSNIFIAAKPGNEDMSEEEQDRLSDDMLRDLSTLNEKHGFQITSGTGITGEYGTEPSFMLTNVPDEAREELNEIARKYGQKELGVSEKGEKGVKYVTPEGQVGMEFGGMEMDPDAEFSTDFPSGQRLTFTNSEPMEVSWRLLKWSEKAYQRKKAGHTGRDLPREWSHIQETLKPYMRRPIPRSISPITSLPLRMIREQHGRHDIAQGVPVIPQSPSNVSYEGGSQHRKQRRPFDLGERIGRSDWAIEMGFDPHGTDTGRERYASEMTRDDWKKVDDSFTRTHRDLPTLSQLKEKIKSGEIDPMVDDISYRGGRDGSDAGYAFDGVPYVIKPKAGSFWSGPDMLSQHSSYTTGLDPSDPVSLLGTTLHPDEVDSQVRPPMGHSEDLSEAFAMKPMSSEDLYDLTPVMTDERGYNPSWFNHPEERDPEHAYAEERKFLDDSTRPTQDQLQTIMSLAMGTQPLQELMGEKVPLLASQRGGTGVYDSYGRPRYGPTGADAEYGGEGPPFAPISPAIAFLREKMHSRPQHSLVQELLNREGIPDEVFQRIVENVPPAEFSMRYSMPRHYETYEKFDEGRKQRAIDEYNNTQGTNLRHDLSPSVVGDAFYPHSPDVIELLGARKPEDEAWDRLMYETGKLGMSGLQDELPYEWWQDTDESPSDSAMRLGIDAEQIAELARRSPW